MSTGGIIGDLATHGVAVSDLWNGMLDILRIVVWPGVLLIVFYFFRRVFAFFLLSLHEINIFGAGLKLVKSPMEVINDAVQQRFESEKRVLEREEERKKEIAAYDTKVNDLTEKNAKLEKEADTGLALAKEILEDLKKSNAEIVTLQGQVESLKETEKEAEERGIEKGVEKVLEHPEEYFDPPDYDDDR